MTTAIVPTFRLPELRNGRQRDELRRCVSEVGMFYLTDAGATTADHQRATEVAMQFFVHATPAEKDAVTNRVPHIRRGYSPLEAESTAQVTSNGDYTDYSMSLSMGLDRNLFPPGELEQVWTRYFGQLYDAARTSARAILEAVDDYPSSEITRLLDGDPVFRLRYFPEVPTHRVAEQEPLRMAPHYDLSLVTLIHQTPCANGFVSLQAKIGSEVVPLPHIDGAIVVMCGAVATVVSEGRVLAPVHHVASPGLDQRVGSARTSSVFFLRPRPDFTFSITTARRCGLDVSLTGETGTFADWIGTNYVTMHTAESAM